MVDYSKWDSLDVDEDEDVRGPPRVTRLEGPSRITIGEPPSSTSQPCSSSSTKPAPTKPTRGDVLDYSKWDSLGDDDEDDEDCSDADEDEDDESHRPPMVQATGPSAATGAASATPAAPAAPPSGAALLAKLTRNGAQRDGYLWRQTETEVELSVLLPPGTRSRQVRVEVRRPMSAATEERARVVVALREPPAPVLDAELAYPVEHAPVDEEDEPEWEVTDSHEPGGARLLRLTLRKQVPHGIVLWWTRALQGEPPLDSTAFPDRRCAPCRTRRRPPPRLRTAPT